MNISDVPIDALIRGAVVSVIDKEKPVIESFTNGKDVITVAFLSGLPIPFNTFLVYMAARMAPRRSKAMMPKNFTDSFKYVLSPEEIVQINYIWSNSEMPHEIRERIRQWDTTDMIYDLVKALYQSHISTDEEEGMAASFKTFIRRIDEDYSSSLIDPVRI